MLAIHIVLRLIEWVSYAIGPRERLAKPCMSTLRKLNTNEYIEDNQRFAVMSTLKKTKH